jgi:uncharacterized phiE125 gp8 family phage protein
MAVTVITAATTTRLTTVTAVKDALGITNEDQDALIARVIDGATAAIQNYTHRIYARQTYEETVQGHNHPMLMLSHSPIVSITSVMCDGDPITDYVVEDTDNATLYRQVGWAKKAWVGWEVEPAFIPGTETTRYTVTYEAGYLLPGEDDRDLPPNVEEAAIITASDWTSNSYHGGGPVKSKTVGDLKIEYQENMSVVMARQASDPNHIPASARSLLSVRLL